MKIAVLGTGQGGRAHAAKLSELGNDVIVGTRDPEATMAATEPNMMGIPPFAGWQAEHPEVDLATFADAAASGEMVINGIDGANAVAALTGVGAAHLAGKVLIDYAVPYIYNPDIEHKWETPWGWMPRIDPEDVDSLGEQIQRAFPDTKVVKSFVTQEQELVVDPAAIGGGEHTMFVAGDHTDAKEAAIELLRSYGWRDIIDLGGIVAARGMEMYAHMHAAIGMALGGHFGVKIVR